MILFKIQEIVRARELDSVFNVPIRHNRISSVSAKFKSRCKNTFLPHFRINQEEARYVSPNFDSCLNFDVMDRIKREYPCRNPYFAKKLLEQSSVQFQWTSWCQTIKKPKGMQVMCAVFNPSCSEPRTLVVADVIEK